MAVTIMPFQYVRDDVGRWIRLTFTDPATLADVVASVEQQLADGAWSYGLLIDARSMSDAPQSSDIRAYVSRVGELVAVHGQRGPIAFVARRLPVIGAAQKYAVLGQNTESLEVFWDIRDAREWLAEQMAAP
jgi:hypothetical protein